MPKGLQLICPTHPLYTAFLKPRVKCPGCEFLFKTRRFVEFGSTGAAVLVQKKENNA